MSEELDCTYCENFQFVDEVLPDPSNPAIVRKYYRCKADVFKIAFRNGELVDYYANCTVRIERTGHKNADELISEIQNLNDVFKRVAGGGPIILVKIDMHFATAIASPCISQNDFFEKNDHLAASLDMDISAIRKLLREYEDNWKGLSLLKQYFQEKGHLDDQPFQFLECIIALRNKTPPAHKFSSSEVPAIMRQIGFDYPPATKGDWQRYWDATILKYTSCLRKIRTAMPERN